jgi:hypothetical protein
MVLTRIVACNGLISRSALLATLLINPITRMSELSF